jgi:WD40 repeat protein
LTFFEDARLKKVTSARQVPAGRSAHEADILTSALMLDSPNMVTAAADGSLKVWNVESGSLRKTLVVRADHLPNHKQAIEALVFMHGPQLKHVLVVVGADQMARWWDIKHCVLQHQMFTGELHCFSPWCGTVVPNSG